MRKQADNTKAHDHFRTAEELKEHLDQAEENASGTWETHFVDDMTRRHARYGFDMFMSEAQYESLYRIATKHIK